MAKKTYATLVRGNVHYQGSARFDRDVEVEVTKELAAALKGVKDVITASGEDLVIPRFEIVTREEAAPVEDSVSAEGEAGKDADKKTPTKGGRRTAAQPK